MFYNNGEETAANNEESVSPCTHPEDYREFDFWLGSWIVRLADGTEAGRNVIRKEQAGCALIERWTGRRGNTGISLNYFDPSANEWVQHWVDEQGTLIILRGGITGRSMILQGTIYDAARAQTNLLRGTWTPMDDGRVRQFFEESADDGATWKEWFEGFYTRSD